MLGRTMNHRGIIFILVGICFCTISNLAAQSRSAKKYFQSAEKAEQVEAKISFYQKAIATDPSFTQAYYQLGLTFESVGRSEEAMQYLGRALFSRPNDMDSELRLKIVFEIGKIQYKLSQYSAAKSSLLGAFNLAKDKKDRLEILKVLAKVLVVLEEYEQAILRFQELIEEDPVNSLNYKNEISTTKHTQEIDLVYRDAMQLLKNRRFKKAISGFQKVIELDPNFKDADEQLKMAQNEYRLLQRREEEFHSQLLLSSPESRASSATSYFGALDNDASLPTGLEKTLFEKGKEQAAEEKWDEAVKSFEAALTINPNNIEARQQLKIAQTELEKLMQSRLLAKFYEEGQNELWRKNWVKAIIAFEKVLNLQPDHKNARTKLRFAQTRLENEGTNVAKQHYYEQAKLAMQSNDWILAEALFERVNGLDTKYKDTKQQLAIVEAKLAEQAKLMALYEEGELLLSRENWQAAIDTFSIVKAQAPNFKNIDLQIKFAQAQLEASQKVQDTPFMDISLSHIVWYSFLIIILLPAIALFALSPDFRGRFYLILDQHDKAMKLYNRLIDNGSISDKLCLSLLKQYMLENRKDDLAIKVYERALRLHLLKDQAQQDEVSAILTQHYLDHWKKEADDIEERITKVLDSEITKTHH